MSYSCLQPYSIIDKTRGQWRTERKDWETAKRENGSSEQHPTETWMSFKSGGAYLCSLRPLVIWPFHPGGDLNQQSGGIISLSHWQGRRRVRFLSLIGVVEILFGSIHCGQCTKRTREKTSARIKNRAKAAKILTADGFYLFLSVLIHFLKISSILLSVFFFPCKEFHSPFIKSIFFLYGKK